MNENKNKINLLPSEVYNKIAAGEVVQRPESVIKELVENSIDAGAQNITIAVKDAGKKLLSVTDDGEGMNEEDLRLSVIRHATSKIKSAADLEKIGSFGFRGEALSSIAAVSQVEIKSRTADEDVATRLYFTSETEFETEKVAASKGTTVTVKNLFYNVPARKNFLKTNATELKRIANIVKYFALAYPEINFKYFVDDKLQMNFLKSNLSSRMKEIYGENFLEMLVEVYEQVDFIEVSGFISKPTFLTDSKFDQHLFVNRRYVKNKSINHAVFSAYQNILSKGEYPFFILFIDIDPEKTDVNIHPTKQEVKFYDEKEIYLLVNAVIKKSLGSYDTLPAMNAMFENKIKKGTPNKSSNAAITKKGGSGIGENELDLLFGEIEKELGSEEKDNVITHPFAADKTQREVEHKHSERNTETESNDSNFVVNLHNKYILTQIKSGLMIIDAYPANVRIIYEKALSALSSNMPFSQQLLFVQTLRIGKEAFKILQEYDKYFAAVGFEIRYFSNSTISITGVPSEVKLGSEVKTLLGILDETLKMNKYEKDKLSKEKFAEIYAQFAASGLEENLTSARMKSLVDQLFATSNPYSSPCDKPIIVKISLSELDKKFGRK